MSPVRVAWIRVGVDLPDHPKAKLLDATLEQKNAWAYAIGLWIWCSRYAQDGRIPASRSRIAEAATGWTGAPGRLLEAMDAVGFLSTDGDFLAVHDWDEHQGRAIQKAERDAKRKRDAYELTKLEAEQKQDAIVAEKARRLHGDGAGSPARGSGIARVRDETRRDETKSSIEGARALQVLWNEVRDAKAPEWRKWVGLAGVRLESARARAAERPIEGPDGWRAVLERLAQSGFSRGLVPARQTGKTWRADPDFIVRPGSADKVLEGKYDSDEPGLQEAPRRLAPGEDLYAGGAR